MLSWRANVASRIQSNEQLKLLVAGIKHDVNLKVNVASILHPNAQLKLLAWAIRIYYLEGLILIRKYMKIQVKAPR